MSERGIVSDQLFPRDIVERITNRLIFIPQQPLYHPWICWEHEQYHRKILYLHSFYLASYLLYKLFPSYCYSLAFLTLLLPPSSGLVASYNANTEQGRNVDYHTHGAFGKLMGWHTVFTFTVVRQRKHIESVYTQGELLEIVLSCADREGATDRHPHCPSGYCGNRYLHVHLQDEQKTQHPVLTPRSIPEGVLVLQNNRFVFPAG